jgi:hypothetical protein
MLSFAPSVYSRQGCNGAFIAAGVLTIHHTYLTYPI